MIKLYDQTGRLSKQMIDFLLEGGLPEYLLPEWDDNFRYNCDWNIIGGEEAKIKFKPYYKPHNKDSYTLDEQKKVESWLIRTSMKLFLPHLLVKNTMRTDLVQKRICTTMIYNLPINEIDKWMIMDNYLFCYWNRKRVFDLYMCKEVMKLPFAPDLIEEDPGW